MAKVWFITGTSRGLGRSLVEAVLQSGDNVIATARNPESLDPLVEKYGSERIHTSALDVTNSHQVFRVVEESQRIFGRIDVVVNNAGYAATASLEDMSIDSFKRQVDANLFGTVWVTKAIIPIMRKQGSGHIIQVSSVGGRLGTPGLSGYQSAKWAVGGLTTVLAEELAPLGIKLTVLEPGAMQTDWAGSSMEVGQISDPYRQTVGKFMDLRDKFVSFASTPETVSKAIVSLSEHDDPPLRLLIGPETRPLAQAASRNLAEMDAKWEPFVSSLGL
ncbi:Oxidoreductase BOA17 [Paramyrothecium foliicola]|nr:Oxidoreductase BOA17 [Paramyrothecium foliicola]